MVKMNPNELIAVLNGIENGSIPLICVSGTPGAHTNVYYEAVGWKFCVFDDAGEWDYFEWIEAPTGERREFPAHGPAVDDIDDILENWQPKNLKAWGY
jgi:hypothetical protein